MAVLCILVLTNRIELRRKQKCKSASCFSLSCTILVSLHHKQHLDASQNVPARVELK